ncbi:monocarboxylate transporter 14-like isoform X2 [Portunus trituberculatus]|nr:monocarboxylate transporter 14-like isoform X2 [Portunus trituberculatus]
MMITMLGNSSGILFLPQLLQWGASSTTVAVLLNTYMVSRRLAGTVTATLTKEFGFRRVAMTGALLTATCLTLTAFATSPHYFFVSFSLGCGMGCGLSSVGFLILSRYFKRRRGLANTCLAVGVGLGNFLGPLFIQLLQDTYGHRGATLVLGAIVLHGFLGTTLYHPVEWHMKFPPRPHPQHEALMSPKSSAKHAHTVLDNSQPRHRSEGLNVKLKELSESHQSLASCRRLSDNSLDLVSMASMTSLEARGTTDLTYHEGREPPHTDTGPNILRSLRRPFTKFIKGLLRDLAILRRPTALIIATGITMVINAQANFIMMVPFAMQAGGHSLQTAAWCLSVSGVINLLVRILTSTLSDYSWFNMRFFYLLSMFTMAASITVFPLQTQTEGMTVVLGMWGAAMGMFLGLNSLHTISVVGLDDYAAMMGAWNLTLALSFVTIGPFLGVVRDASDSYAISLWVAAFLVLVSFLLWFLMPAAVAYDERMKAKQVSSA